VTLFMDDPKFVCFMYKNKQFLKNNLPINLFALVETKIHEKTIYVSQKVFEFYVSAC